MRLLLIFVLLAMIVLIIFFIWGDSFSFMFTEEGVVAWLDNYGQWAWLVAILLLISDIFLPLPATIIMAGLGYIYGPVTGGLINAIGSFVSGMIGYWLCRWIGEKAAIQILGKKDYERGRNISNKVGGLVVALSRWLPVFPEVIACMAGLTRMKPSVFHVALACGSLPLGFTYAYIGHTGVESPILAMALSAGVPPLIWLMIRWFFKRKFSIG